MDHHHNLVTVGLWISDKKFGKINWNHFQSAFHKQAFNLVRLDLDKPLEEQGPFKVLIHKLTDIIAAADEGDVKSKEIIGNVEQYISNHPNMIVIDPLNSVRMLLDRYHYYSLLERQPLLKKHGVFTPAFSIINSTSLNENLNMLKLRGVTFPLICKPIIGHGSKSAHKMSIIFNEVGLVDCKPPCIVQSFINHNAVLYKIYLVGNRYYVVERPSLKNFYPCNEKKTISFHTGDVCKSDSQSTLSILDPHEMPNVEFKGSLNPEKIEAIIRVLRKQLQLVLFGVDIVIDNVTGNYAIIDINVYPGYEGYPNFFDHLVSTISDMIDSENNLDNRLDRSNEIVLELEEQFKNGFDNVYKESIDNLDKHCLINVNEFVRKNSESAL